MLDSSHSQFESCAKNLNIFFSIFRPVANDLIYLIMSSNTSGVCRKCLHISFSTLLQFFCFNFRPKLYNRRLALPKPLKICSLFHKNLSALKLKSLPPYDGVLWGLYFRTPDILFFLTEIVGRNTKKLLSESTQMSCPWPRRIWSKQAVFYDLSNPAWSIAESNASATNVPSSPSLPVALNDIFSPFDSRFKMLNIPFRVFRIVRNDSFSLFVVFETLKHVPKAFI